MRMVKRNYGGKALCLKRTWWQIQVKGRAGSTEPAGETAMSDRLLGVVQHRHIMHFGGLVLDETRDKTALL